MKQDQVLNEKDIKKRFKNHGINTNICNLVNNGLTDDNESDSELQEFWDFEKETIAIDNVETIRKDLEEHDSVLDPITGHIFGNTKHFQVDGNQTYQESTNYLHKKFQHKEFSLLGDLKFEFKNVDVIEQPLKESVIVMNKEDNEIDTGTRLVFEVEVRDNTLESETLSFSFSVKELENIYSQEECNFFKYALSEFRRSMRGTDSMRTAFFNHLTKFGSINENQLTPEFFDSFYQCAGQNR